MKDRYPFLAYWKEQGIRKFPCVPIEVIRRQFIESHGQFIESYDMNPDEVFEVYLRQGVHWVIGERVKLGSEIDRAKAKIMRGSDGRVVLRELENRIFPTTKGGPTFTSNQLRILKSIYLELQDCIKEVRGRLEIPLRSDPYYDWEEDRTQDIKEAIPTIFELFADEEIPLVASEPSVRNTSLKIIITRLKTCVRLPITTRTLENLLNSIPPLHFFS